MITWEKIIESSEIGGTWLPATFTETGSGGTNSSCSNAGTTDWFQGEIKQVGTLERYNADWLAPFSFGGFDLGNADDEVSPTWKVWSAVRYSNASGAGSTTYTATAVSDIEGGGGPWTTEEVILVYTASDSAWSRIDATLNTSRLTTLFNQTGRVTTTTQATASMPTTSLSSGETISGSSQISFQKTTTASVTTLTKETWQPTTTATHYNTGQTTARAYSSFYNQIPLRQNGSTTETSASYIEPLVFGPLNATNSTPAVFTATITAAGDLFIPPIATTVTHTTTTNGHTVDTASSKPQVTTGAQAITSRTQTATAMTVSLVAYNGGKQAATTATYLSATKSTAFAGATVSVRESITYTHDTLDPYAYVSSYGADDIGYAPASINGGFGIGTTRPSSPIVTTHRFATVQPSNHTLAEKVNVFVALNSQGTGGGSYEQVAYFNKFSSHAFVGVLPVKATKATGNTSYTFSANSYTSKVSTQPAQSSTFGTAGQSRSQWITNTIIPDAAIAGGNMSGELLLNTGTFLAYSDSTEKIILQTPEIKTWSLGAATTAFVPVTGFLSKTDGGEAVSSTYRNWPAEV